MAFSTFNSIQSFLMYVRARVSNLAYTYNFPALDPSLVLYYPMDSSANPTIGFQTANYATGLPVYDASMLGSSMITYKQGNFIRGLGDLSLNNTMGAQLVAQTTSGNYVVANNTFAPNISGGFSISLWFSCSGQLNKTGTLISLPLNKTSNGIQIDISGPNMIYTGWNNPFTPTSITGLTLWLDAKVTSSFTYISSTYGNWIDQSGLGNNMAQTASNTGKLVSLVTRNGYPAVYIPQAVPPLRSSVRTTTFPMTFFLVFSVDATSGGTADYNMYLSGNIINNTPAYNGGSGTIQISMNNYAMNIQCTAGNGFSGGMSSYQAPSNGSTFLMTIQIDGSGTSPTNAIWNLNGTLTKSTTFTGSGNATSNANGSILYSGYQASYINECVYYQSYLNSTLLQQVEGYLAWKWGIQANLPTNHPYKNAAP